MAQTKVMDVEVKEFSKFGFKDGQGNYVNWSKTIKDADKSQVVPGRKFSVEMYVADSGKNYVNKVLRQLEAVASVPVKNINTGKLVDSTVVKAVTSSAKSSDTMSKAEWQSKDVRISRQGLFQAAIHALANVVPLEDLVSEAMKLADAGLEYVNRG